MVLLCRLATHVPWNDHHEHEYDNGVDGHGHGHGADHDDHVDNDDDDHDDRHGSVDGQPMHPGMIIMTMSMTMSESMTMI